MLAGAGRWLSDRINELLNRPRLWSAADRSEDPR
jgi:hypothetical protein